MPGVLQLEAIAQAAGILMLALGLVAGSVVLAQVAAVGLIALMPFAGLAAALPGSGRMVTWYWATAFVRALTTIVVMSAFLTFLLLVSGKTYIAFSLVMISALGAGFVLARGNPLAEVRRLPLPDWLIYLGILVGTARPLVPAAGRRLANYLKVMTLEAQTIARACGKNSLHNLEPEDLVALTIEAAAMAGVPLAGTNWIPGKNGF